ncbi:MAG TPA: DUF5103 domain-containing protein, partial [Saprospiraceae bacterium]|nr:DUF5103 domain-containing protein [Saprospiraceae bacterium]
AQPELTNYDDGVFRDYIRSVRMTVNGLALTYPIAALGSMEALYLSFDELDGQGTRYYYTVIHCDRNWQPTQELSQFDYLHGYREGEIRDFEFSTGTYQHYVHYKLSLPNSEVKWTISGNYLLVVYEAGEENNPILTRRFMITEENVKMQANVVRPASVEKQNSSQEIDFTLDISAVKSFNPRMEIFCTILQNGRWDNAIQEIEPRLVTGSLLNYDFTNQIVFDAGKEFRNMDISSMDYRSEDVAEIKESKTGFTTILRTDQPRANQAYLWKRDLDGMYVPYNRDYTRKNIPPDSLASTLNLVSRYNYREQFLGTEYSEVMVTLESEELDKDVYVVGAITDWKLLPEYKLTFDETIQSYTGRLFLKQGYYNYAYAVADKNGHPDFGSLEGNWYATENQYTLLCYFRPRGGQYDQLIGAHTFNSNY